MAEQRQNGVNQAGWIVASATLLASFGLSGLWFSYPNPMPLDMYVLEGVRRLQNPLLGVLMEAITLLGSPYTLVPMAVAAIGAAAYRKDFRGAATVAGLGLLTLAVNLGLKGYFDRPRPEVFHTYVEPRLDSFPSGHALGSGSIFALVALEWRRLRGTVSSAPLWVAVALAAPVGLSRIYLGVHWPSDVVAGWLIAVWLGYLGHRYLPVQSPVRPSGPSGKVGLVSLIVAIVLTCGTSAWAQAPPEGQTAERAGQFANRVVSRAKDQGRALRDQARAAAMTEVEDAAGRADNRARAEAESKLVRAYEPKGSPLQDDRSPEDTDGLPDPAPEVEDYLLAVPRGILLPVYLTTEYLVRWPLAQLFTAIERYHVIEYVQGGLTFADGNAGFQPLFEFGGGRAGSVGLRFFYDELADGALDFSIGASGWPQRNVAARGNLVLDVPNERSQFVALAGFKRRDDYVYYGVGSQPSGRAESRFEEQTALGRLGWRAGKDSDPAGAEFDLNVLDRKVRCSPGAALDACGPDSEFETPDDPYPVGASDVAPLGRDYLFGRSRLHVYWDTRPTETRKDSGIRLEGFGALGVGIGAEDQDLSVARYGAEVSGFVDLFGKTPRTLGLRLYAESANTLGDRQIPVGELVALGGAERMRGFRENRFRGRSSLVATLDYRYPVWSFFEGEVFFEVGNVFSEHWSDFSFGGLRGSAGIGLRTVDMLSRHLTYDINLAVGTATFDDGFAITEFRINAGTNWGF